MLNYLKGEFYKVFHRKSFYVFTGVISLLAIATNVLSCFYGGLGQAEIFDQILLMGLYYLVLPAYLVLLFTDWISGEESKNGTMKNAVSMGVSRSTIYISKFLVALAVSFLSAAAILLALYGSGWLLFAIGGGVSMEYITYLLQGLMGALPRWMACVAMGICLNSIMRSNILAAFLSVGIISILELPIMFLGKIWVGFEVLKPYTIMNQLGRLSMVAYPGVEAGSIVSTAALTGLVYLVFFFLLGLLVFRKKEIR